MKKFFIIVVLAIISTNVFSTEVMVNDTTALTFNKVYEDVKEGIQGLAVALKEPAEHVYKIIVKQQLIHSIGFATVLLLSVVGFILLYKSIKFINQPAPQNSNYSRVDLDEGWIILPIAIGLTSIVFFIIGMLSFDTILTGIINPEYGAITDIMNFIK